MRQQLLLRSVLRHLPNEKVLNVAYMWTRGWSTYLGAAIAAALGMGVATLMGADEWAVKVSVAILFALLVTLALTEYRVLAQTDQRIVLLHASRFRHVAQAVIGDIDPAAISPDGGTLVATDWKIDGVVYTIPKSSEKAITAIAMAVRQ